MKTKSHSIREAYKTIVGCKAPCASRLLPSHAMAVLACAGLLATALDLLGLPTCDFYSGYVCQDLRDLPACPTCGCPAGRGGPGPSGGSGSHGSTGSDSQGSQAPEPIPLCAICGLARWWVSEPAINLRFEDEPLGYQPSRGQRMSFQLSYRQRGAIPEVDEVFGVGPQWSCSLRAFLVDRTATDGTLRLHRGGAGAIVYRPDVMQYLDGSWLTATNSGYQIQYPDGSLENYTAGFTGSGAVNFCVFYFLASRKDPAGNTTTFSYAGHTNAMQLQTVTDLDGNHLHLYYTNATFTNLVTLIQDDFSRTAVLQYDEAAYLTNVTDVAGISGGFQYDAGNRQGWITNFTTRAGATAYASTGFVHGGTDAEDNVITNSAHRSQPLPPGEPARRRQRTLRLSPQLQRDHVLDLLDNAHDLLFWQRNTRQCRSGHAQQLQMGAAPVLRPCHHRCQQLQPKRLSARAAPPLAQGSQ